MTAFALTLNRRVELLQQAGTDELGQPQPDGWLVVGRPLANVHQPRGAEVIRAGRADAKVQVSVRLRYRTDVTEGMRVRDGEQQYVVQAVLPDRVQRRHVDLVCEVVR